MGKFSRYTLILLGIGFILFYVVPFVSGKLLPSWVMGGGFLIVLLGMVGFVLWPLVDRFRSRGNEDFLETQFVDDGSKEDPYGPRLAAVFVAILIFMACRTFVLHTFSVTGGGMEPSYSAGTYVHGAKFSYGYGQYSLPFGAIEFAGRILGSVPARGDVIIYRNPRESSDNIIRVIGVPGDRVQMRQVELILNDRRVETSPSS